MGSKKYFLLIPLILIQVVALSQINTVYGADIAKIYVDPYFNVAMVGETLNVTLKIENVRDLFGWQIMMSFNYSVLEAINVTIGDFLAPQPEGTYSPPPNINNTHGWIGFGETTLGQHPGLDGTGWLGTITFNVKADGESFLNITDPVPVQPTQNATCLLLDSTWPYSKDIPFDTEDGLFVIGAKPVASFSYTPTTIGINQPVEFNASESYDADGNIIQYEWDFGDGSNDTGVVVEHTFTTGGNFSVTLTVTDDSLYGLQGTLTKDVMIRFASDIAVKSVTATPTTVEAGETVYINVTVRNEGTSVATFDVTIYYTDIALEDDDHVAGTLTFTDLDLDATQTLTLDWDTSEVDPATYRIKAVADTLEEEIDEADNTYVDGTVTVEAAGSSFTLYLVAGAVAVAVVGVAVFLFMRRRSP